MLSGKQKDSKKNNFWVESLLEIPGECVVVPGAGGPMSLQMGWVAGTISPTKYVLQELSIFSRARRVNISGSESMAMWSL